jgi:hypothetical protein
MPIPMGYFMNNIKSVDLGFYTTNDIRCNLIGTTEDQYFIKKSDGGHFLNKNKDDNHEMPDDTLDFFLNPRHCPNRQASSRNENAQVLKSIIRDNEEILKIEYMDKGLDKELDTFVLFRIIGNDLYPRHKKGQSLVNLQFVLQHEPEFENCEKIWVVNRIISKEEEIALINLLNEHKKSYIHIPFNVEEYKKIGWNTDCLPNPGYLFSQQYLGLGPRQRDRLISALYQNKNNYVMNNNGARNIALREGKSKAKWILPWDGNCFLTKDAWNQIHADVIASPHYKYFAVPMARVLDNKQLLNDDFMPQPTEEPQLIFRSDSAEEFNEKFWYGRRPKVELLWRLGIPGKWDTWKDDLWDQTRASLSKEARQFGFAGWVARMFSGMKTQELDNEESFYQRGRARLEAIISTIRDLDTLGSEKAADPKSLSFYRIKVLQEERSYYLKGKHPRLIDQLIEDANEALERAAVSVIDKKIPLSRVHANHYCYAAPHMLPNYGTEAGNPYPQKNPDTYPYTFVFMWENNKDNRTSIQRVFTDSMVLALAWYFTRQQEFAENGSRLLNKHFVYPETRISPHLESTKDKFHSAIMELKDIYFYLDAIRLFEAAGTITGEAMAGFKEWLSEYLNWLYISQPGMDAFMASDAAGTYFDLQVAAIADFLGNDELLFETIIRAQSRIPMQFADDGSQPEELTRKNKAQACCFNLQGWVSIAEIALKWGINLWFYRGSNGANLIQAARWFSSNFEGEKDTKQVANFYEDCLLPTLYQMPKVSTEFQMPSSSLRSQYSLKSTLTPECGLPAYWNLGLLAHHFYRTEESIDG